MNHWKKVVFEFSRKNDFLSDFQTLLIGKLGFARIQKTIFEGSEQFRPFQAGIQKYRILQSKHKHVQKQKQNWANSKTFKSSRASLLCFIEPMQKVSSLKKVFFFFLPMLQNDQKLFVFYTLLHFPPFQAHHKLNHLNDDFGRQITHCGKVI